MADWSTARYRQVQGGRTTWARREHRTLHSIQLHFRFRAAARSTAHASPKRLISGTQAGRSKQAGKLARHPLCEAFLIHHHPSVDSSTTPSLSHRHITHSSIHTDPIHQSSVIINQYQPHPPPRLYSSLSTTQCNATQRNERQRL